MRRGADGGHTRRIAPFVLRAQQEKAMLHYAVVFFVIALIAALFGFTGIAAGAASIAQVLFVVFIVLAIASFVLSMFRKR
jgi:uncharacterized membrane protein YtjA (UPF0391 family)